MSGDRRILVLHPADNVAVALVDLDAGTVLDDGVVVAETVSAGHKVARATIGADDTILKFGQPIGVAGKAIAAGEHVHVHNVEARTPAVAAAAAARHQAVAVQGDATFAGFRRADGSVGTRNYVGIISTVNCSATVIRHIAERASRELPGAFPHVDGVCPITHTTGCGMSGQGAGIELLRRTLGGYVTHPNMGAVLVVGLGCEVNDIPGLLESLGREEGELLRTLSIQQAGGTRAAIDAGTAIVRELAARANEARREAVPAAGIRLGLQCGGSDSFSGVSANPALGYAADRLVAAGGTVILAETPEIHGAEHLLLGRAASTAVADALRAKLDWWQDYAARHGATLDNNPSPGNVAGGISTVLEKSLGAVMKSGTTPLAGVYGYGERVDRGGFVFMDSPGYDPCSVTGEIAAGANVVCFTTGRGSVFGAKPVPSIKLATNSAMAAHMADDIDYDCGPILTDGMRPADAGDDIFRLILETASGRQSASERHGLGDFEFVPWQLGAVL